jgi:ubiquinone/menaquinone biosynthesis C-methylase UbiE
VAVSLWGRVFAAGYDRAMAGPERAGLQAHRARLVPRARGHVLEIGGGTGANLPFYGTGVEALVIAEPEAPMADRLRRRIDAMPSLAARASVVRAPAEMLPLPDASVDVAVATLVLCTVRDPARSLSELRRVLAPGGQLLFLEHVRSSEPGLAAWQDRLHGVHKFTGHGCHCNRPTLEHIEASGFRVTELTRDRMRRTLPIVSPLIAGAAVSPG